MQKVFNGEKIIISLAKNVRCAPHKDQCSRLKILKNIKYLPNKEFVF